MTDATDATCYRGPAGVYFTPAELDRIRVIMVSYWDDEARIIRSKISDWEKSQANQPKETR